MGRRTEAHSAWADRESASGAGPTTRSGRARASRARGALRGAALPEGRFPAGQDASNGFAVVVAALSTLAAVALFVSTTVPAIQEARHLRTVEDGRRAVRERLWQELDADASHRIALQIDIQSLMTELDRRGISATPALAEPTPDDQQPQASPSGRTLR